MMKSKHIVLTCLLLGSTWTSVQSSNLPRRRNYLSIGGYPPTDVLRGGSNNPPIPKVLESLQSAFEFAEIKPATVEASVQKGGCVNLSEETDFATSIAKTLKNRNRLNIKRKLVHLGFGILFAFLNHSAPREYFMPFMCIITFTTLLVETLRFRKGFQDLNKIMHFILGSALRQHEMEGKFTGSLYYFSGVTLSAYLFPQTAATLGILQLALADPAASFFGRQTRHVQWSRIENGLCGIGRNKGVLGFAGGALVCFPLNYRALSIAKWGANGAPGGIYAILLASLALGAAGSFADLIVPTPAITYPSRTFPISIDDNFVVPVLSGLACVGIFNYLRWAHGLELSKYIIF